MSLDFNTKYREFFNVSNTFSVLYCVWGVLQTALSGAVVFESAIKEMPAHEGAALQTATHTFLD